MVFRVLEPFTVWRDGMPVAYTAGRLVEDKDPILKTHGALFENVDAAVKQQAARRIEAATNEPGTARTLTPPTSTKQVGTTDDEPPAPSFDPGEHTAPDVLAYLADADEDERERVLTAEAAGKARKGILGDGPAPVE
ncbi:hypothetical protein J3A78_003872 [Streptomyces sp. PvR006]|uniref:hypothetical protein n=1 Tax=Streptomyces sp. PvR006 TaxID=2817860 RepID=UPI001AE50749|nr:hypothetical protein [Streptomyces sp. PvR006]MBP2583394.1 hypothetical protein [Streptomyces sp. PvR006]